MKKTTNPLYVVTNGGKDVQAVENLFELVFTKLGLNSVYEMLVELLNSLLSQVNSYTMLVVIQEFIDDLVSKIEELVGMLPLSK